MRVSGPVVRLAVGSVAVAAVVSACAGGSPVTPDRSGAPQSVAVAGVVTGTPTAAPAGAAAVARRAVSLHGALVVRKEAKASAEVLVRLPGRTPLKSPRVLLVQKVVPGWVQVQLPMRPNGSSGWVAAADVRVETTDDLLTIDLSARRMTIVVNGATLATSKVAVGSAENPTPTGRFFVTDRVRPDDPTGSYGAFALGLSAHSDTLSEFGSGDGQVGIHGTNEPSSIGKAVSHGCIRVSDDVTSLLARIPLGTPVVIN